MIAVLVLIMLMIVPGTMAQTPNSNGSSTNDPSVKPDDPVARLAPERLSRRDLSPEAYAFKQQVYRLHVERGTKSGRQRIFDLPPAELATIPGTEIKMQRKAAAALGQLMAAARADLARDLAATGDSTEVKDRRARAQHVKELGINNAYRPASQQFSIWDRNFQRYYEATAARRRESVGGEHGAAAAELLRSYVGVRVAAPGFSNHQGGIAVDFALLLKPDPKNPDGEKELSASMAQSDPWKESWFWRWLVQRAGEFGFVAYEPEPWHWEYKPEQAQKEQQQKANEKK